ncbi:hypothetical protein ACFL0C_00595 [Patescibacteria group bacterium]
MDTQVFRWQPKLAKLEVRHEKNEMMLVVSAQKAQVVREEMIELNASGTFPNEETTQKNGRFAQFIIGTSVGWWGFITTLDSLLDTQHAEEF